jgi:hypothetical protein
MIWFRFKGCFSARLLQQTPLSLPLLCHFQACLSPPSLEHCVRKKPAFLAYGAFFAFLFGSEQRMELSGFKDVYHFYPDLNPPIAYTLSSRAGITCGYLKQD